MPTTNVEWAFVQHDFNPFCVDWSADRTSSLREDIDKQILLFNEFLKTMDFKNTPGSTFFHALMPSHLRTGGATGQIEEISKFMRTQLLFVLKLIGADSLANFDDVIGEASGRNPAPFDVPGWISTADDFKIALDEFETELKRLREEPTRNAIKEKYQSAAKFLMTRISLFAHLVTFLQSGPGSSLALEATRIQKTQVHSTSPLMLSRKQQQNARQRRTPKAQRTLS